MEERKRPLTCHTATNTAAQTNKYLTAEMPVGYGVVSVSRRTKMSKRPREGGDHTARAFIPGPFFSWGRDWAGYRTSIQEAKYVRTSIDRRWAGTGSKRSCQIQIPEPASCFGLRALAGRYHLLPHPIEEKRNMNEGRCRHGKEQECPMDDLEVRRRSPKVSCVRTIV